MAGNLFVAVDRTLLRVLAGLAQRAIFLNSAPIRSGHGTRKRESYRRHLTRHSETRLAYALAFGWDTKGTVLTTVTRRNSPHNANWFARLSFDLRTTLRSCSGGLVTRWKAMSKGMTRSCGKPSMIWRG